MRILKGQTNILRKDVRNFDAVIGKSPDNLPNPPTELSDYRTYTRRLRHSVFLRMQHIGIVSASGINCVLLLTDLQSSRLPGFFAGSQTDAFANGLTDHPGIEVQRSTFIPFF
ncbi:hypothetical protein SAMN06298226_3006 [Nitrosovibrio sp. Nv4]|nr:hypothetical protein SAMN06298226_3006 [Nitrosovibrio sp. Nv4]